MAHSDYGIEAADDWPVNKVFCDTYEGDDANDRELDLGDDYDLVLIFLEESVASTESHHAMAYAVRTCYGHFGEATTDDRTFHSSMAAANNWFQGKMTGADATKIKLGADGNIGHGTNETGLTYRILALKFGTVQTF